MPNPDEYSGLVAIRALRAMEDVPAEAARAPRSRFEDSIRLQPYPWLGITAGATMLVGAVALFAAMHVQQIPARTPILMEKAATTCPPAAGPVAPQAPQEPSLQPSVRRQVQRPHAPSPKRPREIVSARAMCDGSDPLCGIEVGGVDGSFKDMERRSPR